MEQFFFLFETLFFCVALTVLEPAPLPQGWPGIQKSVCLCLSSVGFKGVGPILTLCLHVTIVVVSPWFWAIGMVTLNLQNVLVSSV